MAKLEAKNKRKREARGEVDEDGDGGIQFGGGSDEEGEEGGGGEEDEQEEDE